MAQQVGYFENSVVYTEGPFVLCNPCGNGWRIEVELKGHPCPVLCDLSIYKLTKSNGFYEGKTHNLDEATRKCDWLNEQVRLGHIVLNGNSWVAP